MQYHDWPHGLAELKFFKLTFFIEAGKSKRERDEIVVGKWVAENHSTYAKTKNVVKRANDDKSAKPVSLINKIKF